MKKLGLIFFMFVCSWKMLLAQEYQFYLRPEHVQKRLTAEDNPLKNVQSTYCASSQKELINPTSIVGRYEVDGVLMDSIGGNWNFTPNVSRIYQICYYPTVGTTGEECKNVTVFPALDVSFTLSDSGDSLCLGQSRTITLEKVNGTGTGNLVSFEWNTGETNAQITIDQAKIYKGKAFDENACADSITYFNKIYTNKVYLGNDVVLCKGDSVTFSVGSSFLNYTWTNLTTSSIIQQGATLNSLKVKTAGEYELIAVDNNCISKDTVNISIDNIQVKLSTPKDSLCYEEQVSLTATPSNFPAGTLTYLWEYKAKNAPKKLIGTTDNIKSITTSADSLGNVNLYYVTIKDIHNCTYKDSLTIFKNDALVANIVPDIVYICGDQTVVNLIQAEASKGLSPYVYNWTASNTAVVRLANEDSLRVGVLSKTPVPSKALLTFNVTDKLACTAKDTVTAKLELFKYKIVKQHNIICPGMTDSLYAEIQTPGSGDYTYLWFGNNLPTNNLPYVVVSPTTPKYHEYNLSIFDNQRKCEARAYTDSILVKEIIANIDFGKDTVISCFEGVNINTSINSTGAVPYTKGLPYHYQWNILSGSGSFTNGSQFQQNTQIINGIVGEYTYVSLDIIDSLGCTDSDSVYIFWNPIIQHDALDTTYICKGNSQQMNITVSGGTGALSVEWKKIKGAVSIENASSISPIFSYASTVSQDTSLVLLTIKDENECEKTDTIIIINTDFKINPLVKDTKVCPNLPIQLDVDVLFGGSNKYTYQWTTTSGTISNDAIKNPLVTTTETATYTITMKDLVTKCIASKSVQIPFTPIVPIITNISQGSALAKDTTVVCFGNELKLNANLSKGGVPFSSPNEYLYTWNVIGDGIGTDASKSNFTIKGGTGTTYTTIKLTIEDSHGCKSTKSTVAYWNKLVKPYVDTTYICTPNKGILSVDSSQGLQPFKTYLWKEVKTPTKLIIENPLEATSFVRGADNDTVQISLTVTDSASCVGSTISTVIGVNFQIQLLAQHDSICPKFNNELTANVTNDGKGKYQYTWSPNTNTISKQVIVNPTNTTTYSVVVKDSITTCQATASKEVKVINLQAIISGTMDTLVSCIQNGKETTLDAKLSKGGSPAYTYTWTSSSNQITVIDANKETVKLVDNGLNLPKTTQVKLSIQDKLACVSEDSISIYWNAPIKVFYPTITMDTAFICDTESKEIIPTITGGTGKYTYRWTKISGNVQLQNSLTSLIQKVNYIGSVQELSALTFEVIDSLGCSVIDTIFVKPNTMIQVIASATEEVVCTNVPTQISLTFEKNGSGSYSYNWTNAVSLNNATIQNPIATPNKTTVYSVTVTDNKTFCTAESAVMIRVVDLTAVISHDGITLSDTVIICIDDVYDLEATNSNGGIPFITGTPYLYDWKKIGTGLLNGSNTQKVSVEQGTVTEYTQYILTISDQNSCKNSDTVTVYWNESIEPKVDTTFICSPNRGLLTVASVKGGSSPYTYQWNPALGETKLVFQQKNDSTFVNIAAKEIAKAVVTVTDKAGCKGTATSTVVGVQLETIITAQYDTICPTLENSLTANVVGGKGSYSYSWFPNKFISDTTFKTVTVKVPLEEVYTVVVEDKLLGCQGQATKKVNVFDIQAIAGNILGGDTILSCVDTLLLSSEKTQGGTGKYTYSWTSTQANQILVNDDKKVVSVLDKGLVRPTVSLIHLKVTDNLGCTASDSVYVNWNPTLSTKIEDDFYACLNVKDILSSVTTGGTGTITYDWKVISGDIQLGSVTTNNEVEFEGLTYQDNSIIELKVTDSKMCQATDTVKIQTQAIKNPSITTLNTVCTGTTILATATGTSSVSATLSYNWNGKDFVLNDKDYSSKISTDTTLLVVIKDDVTGCQAIATESIKIQDMKVSINTSNPKILCFEEDVTLTAVITGGAGTNEYQWLEDLTTDLKKDSAQITLQPLEKGFDTGTYYKLLVKDATGCSAKDSMQLFRNNQIFADAGKDTTLCLGSSLVLGGKQYTGLKNGVSSNLLYNWNATNIGASFNDNNAENPTLTISVATNFDVELIVTDEKVPYCQAKSMVKVFGKTLPKVSIVNANDVITYCEKDSVKLVPAELPYPKGTHLTWTSPSNQISNQDTFIAKQQGTYTLTAIDTFACQNKVFAIVNEIPLSKITIAPLVGLLCTNDKIELTAFVIPTSDANEQVGEFTWNVVKGTGTIEDATSLKTFYNPIITEDSIRIEATYQNVCGVVNESMNAILSLAPDVKATISETEVNIGDSVEYKIISGTKPYYTYTWGFQGTTVDTLRAVGPYKMTYKDEGTYKTSVTVKNSNNNCIASDEFSVKVNTINSFYIPNVFSLSSKNAVNASWRIFGKNISTTEFSVMIYNRWGELVYQTNDLDFMMNTGWNGTDQDNGKEQALGVYTYVIKGKFANNKVFEKVGTVTIVQ